MQALLTLDGAVLIWIQENLRADWLTPLIQFITHLGGLGKIWIVLSLILLCFKRTRTAGAAGLLGLFCSLIINNVILKNLFSRTRPYEVVDGLLLLGKQASDYSFPSGHTGSSFAVAVAVFRTIGKGKARWLLILFAAIMAFTRLYIGIHYPTDILGGLLTGILCGYAGAAMAVFLQRWYETQMKKA